jgi:glycosyltransferase 2 family protein
MRGMLLLLAKATISILLLYFSLRWVNVGALGDRLSRFQPAWMAFALFLLTVQVAFLAARWKKISTACGAELPYRTAIQLSFIAIFFNQVLPSTVGGDGARIWFLARKGVGWARATYSVLIDRIVGVLVLALIVLICLPWTMELIHDPIARIVILMIGFGAVAGSILFVLIGTRFQPWLNHWTLTRHLSAASAIAAALCGSPPSIGYIIVCSIVIHLLTIASAWCCVMAIAAPVSFAQVLILLPPVLLISTIPISIAGWGVRESSMIAAFAFAGLAESDGLTLSILFGAAIFVLGLAGGLVWIFSGWRLGPATQAADGQPGHQDRSLARANE